MRLWFNYYKKCDFSLSGIKKNVEIIFIECFYPRNNQLMQFFIMIDIGYEFGSGLNPTETINIYI